MGIHPGMVAAKEYMSAVYRDHGIVGFNMLVQSILKDILKEEVSLTPSLREPLAMPDVSGPWCDCDIAQQGPDFAHSKDSEHCTVCGHSEENVGALSQNRQNPDLIRCDQCIIEGG